MHENTFLTAQFDADEERLRAAARRMLGGHGEVEDVLAEARAAVGNGVREWLLTVLGRACLRRLQGRSGAEHPGRAPEPGAVDPVWLALLVVLGGLPPGERIAYVLHDLFGLPLDDTARLTGGTAQDAGGLARSARLRVRGAGAGGPDPARGRAVVEHFVAAARARDARALAAVLHPEVVAYSAHGQAHGPAAVAEGAAAAFARTVGTTRAALVDGTIGVVGFADGRPVTAMAFTLRADRIVVLDITTGEDGVRGLDLTFPDH
ncbi:RNA polymerase subunit sigma-70 [Streptomyces sp. NPDC051921]|uniref:RNA polymerase subunit sigma-70 n=1 Tax=Streptomyces sp. NPDC051921 TaxID=3155806 RepID=UPI00343BB9FD